MNDIPEWIKEKNEQKKEHKAMADRQAERSLERSAMFTAQGPEVWQRFVNALKLNADALSKLEGDELFGAASPIGTPPISCQVNVNRQSVKRGPKLTQLVFHFATRAPDVIRVTPHSGPDEFLQLTIGTDNKVGVDSHTPEKMAENIIRKMAEEALPSR